MRAGPITLAALMAALLALATGLSLLKGGLYPTLHEGDMLHMVQIVLREAAGQWPHLDFMTPVGVLAYAPITLFAAHGMGFGEAFVLGQLVVGLALLPAALWAAASRLGPGLAHLFCATVMILAVALVPATGEPGISLSMTYNRWAWAIAFVVLLVALLPPRTGTRAAGMADGAVLGLGLGALALIKVTYLAACAPVAAVALVLRRDVPAAIVALTAGGGVILTLTLAAGPGIWPAYLRDLLAVAGSEVRPYPGLPYLDVIGGTAGRTGSFLLLAAVILARRAGRAQAGLLLLLAAPGLAYVTYQNYGNDPVWLILLGIVTLGLRPGHDAGARGREALTVTGWCALVLGAPILMAMAESPLRNLATDRADTVAVLSEHDGLWMSRERVFHVKTRLSRPMDPTAASAAGAGRVTPTRLLGEPLETCRLVSGVVGWYRGIAEDIAVAGFGSRRTLMADLLDGVWLFGGGAPLEGGAPWYYGGLPGIESAEILVVPQCANELDARARILREVEAAGIGLREVHRTDDYVLLALQPRNTIAAR